ncbi:MAG TPA: PspC domain-containing protein [Bacteroidia bacterium]|nr:PspC domain-containing protein [Bacteroidia bacterium]HNS11947.1 PspC domain-containing protein [Bacteroidia bacterium]
MKLVHSVRAFFETRAFGVCAAIGDKLNMKSSVIRLFFIYSTFLTIGSPIIIYMILAFWLKMKNYVRSRRSSVWDL